MNHYMATNQVVAARIDLIYSSDIQGIPFLFEIRHVSALKTIRHPVLCISTLLLLIKHVLLLIKFSL